MKAASKQVRLYVEYPSWLPGGATAAPRDAGVERAVVRSGFFGAQLPPLRILSVNGLRFIPAVSGDPHLVAARVAGFDSAVYGLPREVHPLLFEMGGKLASYATRTAAEFTGSDHLEALPYPLSGWTDQRDFPSFAPQSFHDWWRENRGNSQ